MGQHALGEPACGSLDSEVAEHGVRLPASEELDVVLVHAGAEKRGGAAGAQGARGEQLGIDAREVVDGARGMPQGVGHELALHRVVAFVFGVCVVVVSNGVAWLARTATYGAVG